MTVLGDLQRTQLQETGELVIEPRATVYEINDLLSDLGLILGDSAHITECITPYGLGMRITCEPLKKAGDDGR